MFVLEGVETKQKKAANCGFFAPLPNAFGMD
jgi:hypothetical protein